MEMGGWGRWWAGSAPPAPLVPPLVGHLLFIGVGMGLLPLGRQMELYLMFLFPCPCICGWSWQWGQKLPSAPVVKRPNLFCWEKCCHLAVRVLGGIPSYFSRNDIKMSLIFSSISGSLQLISVTQPSQLSCSFSSTPPQTPRWKPTAS